MKKWWLIVLSMLFLCGCGETEVMETVGDELLIPVIAPAKELYFYIPKDASEQVFSAEDGDRLYFCNGYSLTAQTLKSGDLDQSVQRICGYDPQMLTVMQTQQGDVDRYDWVFTCAGEGGNQVGRAAILDDGSHHYCLSTMTDEQCSGELQQQWDQIFSSIALSEGTVDQSS